VQGFFFSLREVFWHAREKNSLKSFIFVLDLKEIRGRTAQRKEEVLH
jgi:hypothetical protein